MKLELREPNLRELRKAGFVPGVMYGKSIESTSVQAELKEVFQALKTYGKHKTFKVRVDGKYHHVYFKNIQSNILKPFEIIHFDLHRVTPTEMISGDIAIELLGTDAFHNQNVYPELVVSDVHAEYTSEHGVSSIQIDVTHLKMNDTIKVKDLKVPEGVRIKNDLDQVVVFMKEILLPEEDEDEEKGVEVDVAPAEKPKL